MDKTSAEQIISGEIQKMIDAFIPHGGGATITEIRFRTALEKVGAQAFTIGQDYALTSLMTVEEVALTLGISERRVRAIAKNRHDRFGVGFQVPGSNTWLFRPEELESLRPWSGKPRKTK